MKSSILFLSSISVALAANLLSEEEARDEIFKAEVIDQEDNIGFVAQGKFEPNNSNKITITLNQEGIVSNSELNPEGQHAVTRSIFGGLLDLILQLGSGLIGNGIKLDVGISSNGVISENNPQPDTPPPAPRRRPAPSRQRQRRPPPPAAAGDDYDQEDPYYYDDPIEDSFDDGYGDLPPSRPRQPPAGSRPRPRPRSPIESSISNGIGPRPRSRSQAQTGSGNGVAIDYPEDNLGNIPGSGPGVLDYSYGPNGLSVTRNGRPVAGIKIRNNRSKNRSRRGRNGGDDDEEEDEDEDEEEDDDDDDDDDYDENGAQGLAQLGQVKAQEA